MVLFRNPFFVSIVSAFSLRPMVSCLGSFFISNPELFMERVGAMKSFVHLFGRICRERAFVFEVADKFNDPAADDNSLFLPVVTIRVSIFKKNKIEYFL